MSRARTRPGAAHPAGTPPLRCVRCRAEVAPSPDGADVPVCAQPLCAAMAARGRVVLGLLAPFEQAATAVEVAAQAAPSGRHRMSTSAVSTLLQRLHEAGLAEPVGVRTGRRSPAYRLSTAGRAVAAHSENSAASPASTTPQTHRGPARSAVGYMSSARLSVPQQRRVARLLREWAQHRGLDIELFVETLPGSRDAFDRMRDALSRHETPTVVLPSDDHLAVGVRRRAALHTDLEQTDTEVVTMDDTALL